MGFGAILVNLPLSGAVDQLYRHRPGVRAPLTCCSGQCQTVPTAFVHRHRRHDRLRASAVEPEAAFYSALRLAFCAADAGLRGKYDIPECLACRCRLCGRSSVPRMGPTAIFLSNYFGTKYLGAIVVAATAIWALVPIIQPPVIRAITNSRKSA